MAPADHSNRGLVVSASPQLVRVLRILGRKRGFPVVLIALLVEATVIISFVAGPMFLLYVFVPLAVTTLLASIAAAPRLRRRATG